MIKFPELNKTFIQFKDCTKISVEGCEIWICPACKNHKMGYYNDFHDCKEIIYDDELTMCGKLLGGNTQCGCYSREHGKRERNKI